LSRLWFADETGQSGQEYEEWEEREHRGERHVPSKQNAAVSVGSRDSVYYYQSERWHPGNPPHPSGLA
jgi:hypothetical protein